jgi:IS5 family transposase
LVEAAAALRRKSMPVQTVRDALSLTGGEVSDYKAVPALLNLPMTQPKMMLADKGYDGDDVRSSLLMHGILPVIPPKANRKEPITCDFKAYKDRNRIERI